MTTIGVCGFGRCGSTMVMEMLRAGGIEPVEGSASVSHELSELSPEILGGLSLSGRSVKLLDYPNQHRLPQMDWRFVWCDRDPIWQAQSIAKFLAEFRVLTDREVALLARSLRDDRVRLLSHVRRLGPTLVVNFERTLANPRRTARSLGSFVGDAGFRFDAGAAGSVVHTRGPEVLPTLDFETQS